MRRRTFLGTALAVAAAPPRSRPRAGGRWDDAVEVLERATAGDQVDAAVLHVVQKDESFTRHFGKAGSGGAMFLLGSISKPISVTAVMTLFDQGEFQLDDRVQKFLPAFTGDGRGGVVIRHLLTHTSGPAVGVLHLDVDAVGEEAVQAAVLFEQGPGLTAAGCRPPPDPGRPCPTPTGGVHLCGLVTFRLCLCLLDWASSPGGLRLRTFLMA
jgi:CubicO group peptidase (beta-lactamase class C family)